MEYFKEPMEKVAFAAIWVFLLAAMALIGAIPTFFLWNWLLPSMFGLPKVEPMEAWGIVWLSGILFKSPPR